VSKLLVQSCHSAGTRRIHNICLSPLSFLYKILSTANRKLTKSKKLPKPVISIGNITWGGSGKTPLVIELAKFIISQNKKVAILTRGYGRKNTDKAVLVKRDTDPKDCGDEPLLISKSVPTAAVIVGANRYENALTFQKEINPDIYILDDGFQHWKIQRDLDIVCINAPNPFGNNLLIPAGILRENLSALKRAGLIIITNADMISEGKLAQLKKQIFDLTGKKALAVFYGDYEIKKLNLMDNFDYDRLNNNPVYALSGIGFAQGFLNSLKNANIKIKDSFIMRDHKKYSRQDLEKIFEEIGTEGILITTAKDAVKINEIIKVKGIEGFCDGARNDRQGKKVNGIEGFCDGARNDRRGIEGFCAFPRNDRRDEKIAVLTVKLKFLQEEKQKWEKEILKVLASF
jgi:tetraacyldisaccharide 4'-kinase